MDRYSQYLFLRIPSLNLNSRKKQISHTTNFHYCILIIQKNSAIIDYKQYLQQDAIVNYIQKLVSKIYLVV
jgi:hypothetical protein